MNTMFKIENKAGTNYITCDSNRADEFETMMKEFGNVERYEAGEMTFEALPTDIQEKVKSILKAYNDIGVDYENGKFSVSAVSVLSGIYATDHFVCGVYKAKELYTKEERRQNYIEEFGYAPAYID